MRISYGLSGTVTVEARQRPQCRMQVADRVIFMDEGQVVEVNTPDAFFRNPQHERTRLLRSSRPGKGSDTKSD
jgi:ABC-type polar amino acid transport system ATPase subunit